MALVGVIGGGAMGGAIVRGCLDAGVVSADGWLVAEADGSKRAVFEGLGVRCVASAGALMNGIDDGDAVVLAVKPQQLDAVAQEVRGRGFAGLVLTILAGTPSGAVREAFGGRARVVRAMPNTPARVGLGLTGVSRGAGATPEDAAFAERLFAGVGRVVRIDESQMDALTAVAGSGPAYVFYLAEAMEHAGRELGLAGDEVAGIVSQTIAGAAALLNEEGSRAAALRRAVTSKRGTTEAATTFLDESGVMGLIEGAIGRACARGAAIAEGKE